MKAVTACPVGPRHHRHIICSDGLTAERKDPSCRRFLRTRPLRITVRTNSRTEEFPMKHGYLIDMDGVLYRGRELIAGADAFIHELRARAIPFRLLTNNSQRARRDVVTKLSRLGIKVEEEHVFTSAMAIARFLALQKPNGTA